MVPFAPEYLYIEEYLPPSEKIKQEADEEERGVIIINLGPDEEDE